MRYYWFMSCLVDAILLSRVIEHFCASHYLPNRRPPPPLPNGRILLHGSRGSDLIRRSLALLAGVQGQQGRLT